MASGKLICLALFLVALQPGISYSRGFTMPYAVDSSGNVGFRPAITVDRNNKTHIAYYDLTEATIKYATNASGTWKTYTIDDIVGIDTNPSSQINTVVTVDSNNKAHIAYFYQVSISGSEYFRLKYANNRSGSWAIEQVCSENNSRGEASVGMAIDSKDDIYAVFKRTYNSVVLSKRKSSGWETVYTVGLSRYDTGPFVLKFDKNDYPHIIYCHENFGTLNYETNYETNRSGSWKHVQISDDVSNWGASLSNDSSGNAHFVISHQAEYDCDIYYGIGYEDGEYFKKRIADAPGYYSPPWHFYNHPSIAVDSKNTAHVFFDRSTSSYSRIAAGPYYIQYMYGYRDAWSDTYYIVDSLNNAFKGRYISVAVDSLDGLHLAYYDDENGDLKYLYSPSDNPPKPCPDCGGDNPVVENFTFYSGAECVCVGNQTLTIGPGVIIKNGAIVTFKAPKINVKSAVQAEEGATVNMKTN